MMIDEKQLAEKMDKMYADLETMDQSLMMENLKVMGCTWSYEQIVDELTKNWNDLKVSDKIFETCTIDDTCSIYPRDFIDEAIYLILSKFHHFKFEHYGLISKRLDDLCEAELDDCEKIAQLESCFQRFFKMCKCFDLDNFDRITYEVNDGIDLHSIIVDYLDECMEQGRMNDPRYYQKIIDCLPNREPKDASVNLLQLLMENEIPSIIVEMGFLTDNEEADFLMSDDGQNQLSMAIVKGLLHELGIAME